MCYDSFQARVIDICKKKNCSRIPLWNFRFQPQGNQSYEEHCSPPEDRMKLWEEKKKTFHDRIACWICEMTFQRTKQSQLLYYCQLYNKLLWKMLFPIGLEPLTLIKYINTNHTEVPVQINIITRDNIVRQILIFFFIKY